MKKEDKDIVVSRCFGCKKVYLLKLMNRIQLAEPEGDGIIRQKRYLCNTCFKKLEELSFVQETEQEKKQNKTEEKDDKFNRT